MSSDDVKDLLLRFGAVLTDEMILVGWKMKEHSNWIAAVRDPISYGYTGYELEIDDEKKYSGYVLFYSPPPSLILILGLVFGIAAVIAIIIIVGVCCINVFTKIIIKYNYGYFVYLILINL